MKKCKLGDWWNGADYTVSTEEAEPKHKGIAIPTFTKDNNLNTKKETPEKRNPTYGGN